MLEGKTDQLDSKNGLQEKYLDLLIKTVVRGFLTYFLLLAISKLSFNLWVIDDFPYKDYLFLLYLFVAGFAVIKIWSKDFFEGDKKTQKEKKDQQSTASTIEVFDEKK